VDTSKRVIDAKFLRRRRKKTPKKKNKLRNDVFLWKFIRRTPIGGERPSELGPSRRIPSKPDWFTRKKGRIKNDDTRINREQNEKKGKTVEIGVHQGGRHPQTQSQRKK